MDTDKAIKTGELEDDDYQPIQSAQIPPGVRFDVPRRNQGQIIEVAYGGFGRSEHDDGDLYRRVFDQSEPPGSPDRVRYYKRKRSGGAR
jgi:hypothetical protein